MANGFTATPFGPAGFSSGNAGANALFMTQLTVARTATAAAVTINIQTAISGIQVQPVIYDSAHSVLVATGPVVTALVVGYNRLPLTGTPSLSAGNCYAGYIANSGVQVTTGSSGSTSWFATSLTPGTPPNPLSSGSSNGTILNVGVEFAGTGPVSGFGPDYSSAASLTGGNTANLTSARDGARSAVTHLPADGKRYAEYVATSGASGARLGIAAADVSLTAPTNDQYPIGQFQTNGTTIEGCTPAGLTSVPTGIGTFANGDVIGIAYDCAASVVWFNKNNGAWFGSGGTPNPATGANGVAVTTGNWPVMLTVLATAAATIVLRDLASQQSYTPPAGFSAWTPPPPPPPGGPMISMIV